METIVKECNNHYHRNLDTLLDDREHIRRYLSEDFKKRVEKLSLGEGQFLLHVGRYSGAIAVTIEVMREIKVKVSGGGRKWVEQSRNPPKTKSTSGLSK